MIPTHALTALVNVPNVRNHFVTRVAQTNARNVMIYFATTALNWICVTHVRKTRQKLRQNVIHKPSSIITYIIELSTTSPSDFI